MNMGDDEIGFGIYDTEFVAEFKGEGPITKLYTKRGSLIAENKTGFAQIIPPTRTP